MSFIDPSITNITEAEKAVINKYGFELRSNANSHYVLTDPVVMKSLGVSASRKQGGNLHAILNDAVATRKQFEETKAKAETDKTEGIEVSASSAWLGTFGLADPITKPKTSKPPAKKSEKAGTDTSTQVKQRAGAPAPPTKQEAPKTQPAAPKPEAKQRVKATEKAPKEINEEVELDNSGKRERKGRKEEKVTVRKEGRYVKAVKLMFGDLADKFPDVSAITKNGTEAQRKALARSAGFSEATAGHCFEAWSAYIPFLIEKGWLKFPK